MIARLIVFDHDIEPKGYGAKSVMDIRERTIQKMLRNGKMSAADLRYWESLTRGYAGDGRSMSLEIREEK